jgi:hypothetical protein
MPVAALRKTCINFNVHVSPAYNMYSLEFIG